MFWCTQCLNSWSRKEKHDKHFSLKKIIAGSHGPGGDLIDNVSFGKPASNPAQSLSEAKMLKRQCEMPINKMFKKQKLTVINEECKESKQPADILAELENTSVPSNDTSTVQLQPNNVPCSSKESNCLQQDINSKIWGKLCAIEEKQDQLLQATLFKANPVKEQLFTEYEHVQHKINASDDHDPLQKALTMITYAKSVDAIMSNDLVKYIFRIQEESNSIVCNACESDPKCKHKGIALSDTTYSSEGSTSMEVWFSHFKKALRNHINDGNHLELVSLREEKLKDIV